MKLKIVNINEHLFLTQPWRYVAFGGMYNVYVGGLATLSIWSLSYMRCDSQPTTIAVQDCWKEYGLRRITVITPSLKKALQRVNPRARAHSRGCSYVTKCLRVWSCIPRSTRRCAILPYPSSATTGLGDCTGRKIRSKTPASVRSTIKTAGFSRRRHYPS